MLHLSEKNIYSDPPPKKKKKKEVSYEAYLILGII